METTDPATPPKYQELRPTNVFVSAGLDALEWVERIRQVFQAGLNYQVVKYSANLPLTDPEFDPELHEVDAAVVLLSPGYLDTYQAVATEYPAILRHEREEGLPVFRVVAVPLSGAALERLSIHPSQITLEKSLEEMDDVERSRAIEMLARAVQDAIEGGRRARDTGPGLHAQQLDLRQQEVSAGGERPSDLPLGAGNFRMAPAAEAIVARASSYAGSGGLSREVSTTLLLIALAEAGAAWEEKWAASWLYERMGQERLVDLRSRFFDSHDIDPEAGAGRGLNPTTGVALALSAAADIAKRTTGIGEIRTRHLLAALLTDRRGSTNSGALSELERMGLRVSELRRELFEFVRNDQDDDAEWSRILLGREVRVYRVAGFHADDTRGEDLLGIEQDVLAFATLIAARTVTPPLSIGLFGEWGSGKSFFMRHLRNAVAGLAREAARSRQMQRDLPFYKRIVQIEFNAWHYVEGNLWASLVEHIFRNLSIPGDHPTASQALQKRLMDDLQFTEQARAEVNEERRRALREVAAARKRVAAARREHERQREALAALAAKDVASELTTQEVRSAVGPVLERLGIPAAAAGAQDLLAALSEARALVERGRGVFLPLVRASEGERRRRTALLMMVLFLGPVVTWLVGAALRAMDDAAMAQLTAFASGAAALLTTGAAWVRSQVKWGSDRLAEVEKAQREVDRRLAEKQAEQTRELRTLQEQLQLARSDYEAARRSQLESEKRVKRAQAKLEESSVARLLASFIEDRAASADYRKHLGMLALVRNDFEMLSGLIEEENWRLSPSGHDDDRYPHTRRFEALDEEERQTQSRINRIVLYIDDLDRCPPSKVVEVLQAVHLLLAFPLFVVVVGVDARWVKRSLEVRYRELLHGESAESSAGTADLLIGKATTDDYLEKIFQVPFWLRPMDEANTSRMVRGLLGSSVPLDESVTETRAAELAKQHVEAEQEGSLSARIEVRGGLPGPGRPVMTGGLTTPRESKLGQKAEEPQVNLESLVFRPEELEFMASLAPLLDRSPRALKRFVNVYRLIKAGLTPAQQRAFQGTGEQEAPYRAVLFLLAVDTGLPEFADEFYTELRAVDDAIKTGTSHDIGGIFDLVLRVGRRDDDTARRWARLLTWMHPGLSSTPRFNPPIALLVEWVPRVMRYSFRARG